MEEVVWGRDEASDDCGGVELLSGAESGGA